MSSILIMEGEVTMWFGERSQNEIGRAVYEKY